MRVRFTKLLLMPLLALVPLIPVLAVAQTAGVPGDIVIPLISDLDLDATSYTYYATTGQGDSTKGQDRFVSRYVKTTGASATVVAVTAGQAPFLGLNPGDELRFNVAGNIQRRYVATKTDNDNITVGGVPTAAIDLSVATGGYQFWWRKRVSGTGATDGYVYVNGFRTITWEIQVDQMNLTSGTIDARIECADEGAASAPARVFYRAFSVAGITDTDPDGRTKVILNGPWDRCRLGLRINGTDDGTDTGAAAEKISATLTGRF